MLECDYPHSDSTWPDTVSLASKWLGHLSDEVQHKITVGNACAGLPLHPGRPGDALGPSVGKPPCGRLRHLSPIGPAARPGGLAFRAPTV